MKNILISSAVVALLVLSGCSSKEPIVDEASSQSQDNANGSSVQTETVSSDNTSVVGENGMSDSNEMNMANLEKGMTSIYFDYDKFNVRSDMKGRVSNDAKLANSAASKLNIKLEGNCDEWGSDEYNFALGLKRANTIKKALISEGVSANRISMVSYGETNPSCTAKTKACWSKNRRVDFKLLP